MFDDDAADRLEHLKERLFGAGPPPDWVEEQIRQAVEAGDTLDEARKRVYLLLASDANRETEEAADWSERVEPIGRLLRSYAPTLSDDAVRRIARLFELVSFPEGYEIIRQDEPGDALYLIASGEVEVTRSPLGRGSGIPPRHLATLGPGAVVGEMSLIYNQPRNANAVARTPVKAFRLSRDNWIHIQGQYPVFAARIEQVARRRSEENRALQEAE